MKTVIAQLGLAIGASAAALIPRDQCCFGLTASGGVSGVVGQLGDGQNRIAQTAGLDVTEGSYCLNNGQITDGKGRGCILTPPTTQFQCDVGATPSSGFSVADGKLTHDGDSTFYACPTGDNGGYNIYTVPVEGQTKCVTVSLSTGGKCSSSGTTTVPAAPVTKTVYSTAYATVTSCGPQVTDCPAESTVTSSWVVTTSSVVAPPPASTTASGPSACQSSLTGAYETPHAIIPVDSTQPDKSYGTQYFAYIGNGNSTVFNFDIPSSYAGKQCSVIFLFPKQSDLETSSFTLSGSGGLTFSLLSSAADLDVTYNTLPSVATSLGEIPSVTPGNSWVVATGSCPAGTRGSVEVSATGSLALEYFEDWNPSPIGLFVTAC